MRRGRRIVPLLFVIPFISLALRFGLDAVGLGEPYPSVAMPGFEGRRANEDGTVDAAPVDVEVAFQGAQDTAHTTLNALIAPMPGSMVGAVFGNMFRPRPTQPIHVSGIKAWLEQIAPVRRLRRERFSGGNPASAETRRWLRTRLSAMYPGRQPEWIAFHQYLERYRVRDFRLERVERTRAGSYRIEFVQ
jgi:hypothetical protein